jgi:hypothetical protein
VAIITYKKNRVPKNSTTNLLIIGLDWIGLNWIELIGYCVIKYYNINILLFYLFFNFNNFIFHFSSLKFNQTYPTDPVERPQYSRC